MNTASLENKSVKAAESMSTETGVTVQPSVNHSSSAALSSATTNETTDSSSSSAPSLTVEKNSSKEMKSSAEIISRVLMIITGIYL